MKKLYTLILAIALTACQAKQEPVFTYGVLPEDKIAELIMCLEGASPARCEYELNQKKGK